MPTTLLRTPDTLFRICEPIEAEPIPDADEEVGDPLVTVVPLNEDGLTVLPPRRVHPVMQRGRRLAIATWDPQDEEVVVVGCRVTVGADPPWVAWLAWPVPHGPCALSMEVDL